MLNLIPSFTFVWLAERYVVEIFPSSSLFEIGISVCTSLEDSHSCNLLGSIHLAATSSKKNLGIVFAQ